MTFTCVKSGKKLVWNKGVKVAAAVPKAPTSFDDLVQNYEGIAYAAWSKSRTRYWLRQRLISIINWF